MMLEVRETEESVRVRTRYSSYIISQEGDEIYLEAAGLEETYSSLDFPSDNLVAIACYLVAKKESEVMGV